ncbi:MAG: hypothetical protein A2Y40_10355 [Candidatus Margulisbacteria bacterium GWF2_35_9]|nr:MAG: hypothetical protein A2Y40_10355 [Candidatus Margulisbacteria bacterium GWF2_35_9]
MFKNKIISSIYITNTFKLFVGGNEIKVFAIFSEAKDINTLIHSVEVIDDTVVVYCNKDEFSDVFKEISKIVTETSDYFKNEYLLANYINHSLFKVRTKGIQKQVNDLIKNSIKLNNLNHLTTHRRRGGGEPSSNIRGSRTRISFLIRQPVSFSDELGLPASSQFEMSTKRNSIIFFLHAIPKDYQDISKGFKNIGIKFRHYKSIEFPRVQNLELLKYMGNILEYPSKNIQFNRLIKNGEIEPFIHNLLRFFDELIEESY